VTEKLLITMQDLKLRSQINELRIGEVLSSEKPSRHFLDIASCKKSVSKLEDIRQENGDEFKCPVERAEYISKFYEKLYRRVDTEGTVEEFLGPAICNSDLVKNSRLTADESDSLDMPLRIEELDNSLRIANFKSAPGEDKISNNFIRAFWTTLRSPMFSVATYGLENNNLPRSFKTADIKLIPKKGDLTQIKNWRPISLLSNFYKLISRAINVRLKVIAPRILSRAQKGFAPGRYMHETLINTFERISYCKKKISRRS
jgi:hypothetical protein